MSSAVGPERSGPPERSEKAERAERAERTWAGSTLEARRAQRRETLLEAALELVGSGGAAAVTVRSVCRQARLTDRYFYENFPSRDDLLVELFSGVMADMFTTVNRVVESTKGARRAKARAGIEAIVMLIQQDPRKARLVFVESLSDPALVKAGIGGMPALSRAFRSYVPATRSREKQNMTTVALSGGIAALLVAWQSGDLKVDVEELVDHCVDLIVASGK